MMERLQKTKLCSCILKIEIPTFIFRIWQNYRLKISVSLTRLGKDEKKLNRECGQ